MRLRDPASDAARSRPSIRPGLACCESARCRGARGGPTGRRDRRVPTAPCRPSCRRRPTRTVWCRSTRARSTRRVGAPSRGPARWAPSMRPGEPPVVADLELGREHGVEAEVLRDRPQVDGERGRHDHEAVPLGAVPVGELHRLVAQVAGDDLGGERPRVASRSATSRPPTSWSRISALTPLRLQCERPAFPPATAPTGERAGDRGRAGEAAEEGHEVVAGSTACRRSRTRRPPSGLLTWPRSWLPVVASMGAMASTRSQPRSGAPDR